MVHSCAATFAVALGLLSTHPIGAAERHPAPLQVVDSQAASESLMKPYDELIEHSPAKIKMLPIPGGQFSMGSPKTEEERQPDEGPQHQVKVSPFWMAECEITWNAYEIWMSDLDILRREVDGTELTVRDKLAEPFQISKPTEPYTDMTFGMGKRGYPAICMTQHAARTFCQWLSAKTGRYYRLPTEAEWEYACRAGTTTAYSFGNDTDQIGDYAWYYENSDEAYSKVRTRKPNPWGLYDMHGNVAEWVLDQHGEDTYSSFNGKTASDPLQIPLNLYPRVVRGGSWDDDPELLRSAARVGSNEDWKEQDPQEPQSIWYHTDALHVGFRIVRPLVTPSEAEKAAKWNKTEPLQVDLEE
ncbi:MAG: formylglycine-generating enzyme family protein [Pirellulaceae bacterium]|jgi:formylglycine-generating enzyme required for sulfatase activity|nr:formylglycine-generating enzyme family protein [Pirellulaceae bacterium]MDP6556660.1 formylglycine-generating enzyme family protein [Pirellulaceae bacterium]